MSLRSVAANIFTTSEEKYDPTVNYSSAYSINKQNQTVQKLVTNWKAHLSHWRTETIKRGGGMGEEEEKTRETSGDLSVVEESLHSVICLVNGSWGEWAHRVVSPCCSQHWIKILFFTFLTYGRFKKPKIVFVSLPSKCFCCFWVLLLLAQQKPPAMHALGHFSHLYRRGLYSLELAGV